MKLVKKILINPTKDQKETFDFWFRRTKVIYNIALEHKIEYYKRTRKSISYYDQKKELVDIKNDDKSWKDVPNKSLTDMLNRLDKSFKSFYKRGFKGFPKFMSENNSLYFVKSDVKVKKNKLYLPKIKKDIKYSESLPTNYSSCLLTKENNSYFIIFTYDIDYENKKENIDILGIDLGLESLYTDSNGYKQKRFSRKLYKSYRKRIDNLNKSLSTKKKGSKRRKKVKKQLAKAYKRLSNTNNDYLHKASRKLVNCKEHNVALGNINVKNIIDKSSGNKSKKGLIKSFYGAGLGKFKNFVEYKTRKLGKFFIFVEENYTSKTCSCCGHINKDLKLSDRMYKCNNCENSIDRDHNSAINMKLLGSSSVEGNNTIYACTYDPNYAYNEISHFEYIL
jgi:putative transposase